MHNQQDVQTRLRSLRLEDTMCVFGNADSRSDSLDTAHQAQCAQFFVGALFTTSFEQEEQ